MVDWRLYCHASMVIIPSRHKNAEAQRDSMNCVACPFCESVAGIAAAWGILVTCYARHEHSWLNGWHSERRGSGARVVSLGPGRPVKSMSYPIGQGARSLPKTPPSGIALNLHLG